MVSVMPDPIALVVDYLDSHALITGMSARVAVDLTGYQAGDRWLTVTVVGGLRDRLNLTDNPRIDINAYAETKPKAHELCEKALTALLQMRNHTTDSAVVRAVEVGVRPFDLSDPLNNQARFVASLSLWIRAN